LVGFVGVPERAPPFFSSALLRYSSERDDGRDGHKPMNTNIMCRRVVDPPRFHLANGRQFFVICDILVGRSDCQPRHKWRRANKRITSAY
jgi:hypothetical protein